jgi:predicted TIM-barrel fold metal-dependent hydrolase
MTIDFHVHIETKSNGIKYSAEEIVAAMDQADIDISVLLGNDQADAGTKPAWVSSSIMAVAVNCSDEEIYEYCSKYPNRFVGFTSVHPDRYKPELKVERAIKEYGMKGIKLYPHSGFYPNDYRLYGVYQKCIESDVPVMIHTGIKAVQWQSIKYNNPIFIDDVAVRFPELKIVMCHGGYPWVEEFMTVVHTNPNTWVDLSFLDYIEKMYCKPGLVETTLKRLIKLVGIERIVWGSEGPFLDLPLFGKHGVEYYKKSQDILVNNHDFISENDKNKILGGNAAKILKLNDSIQE